MQIFDHNIGFGEKRQFFRRKLAKIAENCDHNIDPWSQKQQTFNEVWTLSTKVSVTRLGNISPFGRNFSRKKWLGDCLGHSCGHWAIF
jgi:hypothetical protein